MRRRTAVAVMVSSGACLAAVTNPPGPGETVSVELRVGGTFVGRMIDGDRYGVVIVTGETPYVFAWEELDSTSAVDTFRRLLTARRGGATHLTADDYLDIGRLAFRLNRADLARPAMRRATRLDPSLRPETERAMRNAKAKRVDAPGARTPQPESQPMRPDTAAPDAATRLSSTDRLRLVRDAYERFGREVVNVMGSNVVRLETDHFLVWTDWKPGDRRRLAVQLDDTYTALCGEFGLDGPADLLAPKCPVFCWRSRPRFEKFARYFDGYDVGDALGYTRSVESSGHVHMVLLRPGGSRIDADRFACTLLHEGTHALVHRLHTSRLIPHWINEGLAELMSERVGGDQCPAGEKADLLARQYVRREWNITELLNGVGPIPVHRYPLAHSVIAYLDTLGRARLLAVLADLKAGKTVPQALSNRYNNLTLDRLELDWRAWVRVGGGKAAPGLGGLNRLP